MHARRPVGQSDGRGHPCNPSIVEEPARSGLSCYQVALPDVLRQSAEDCRLN